MILIKTILHRRINNYNSEEDSDVSTNAKFLSSFSVNMKFSFSGEKPRETVETLKPPHF